MVAVSNSILIVDDDLDFSDYFKEMLESWGTQVQVAHTLGQAQTKLLNQRYGSVFLDLHLDKQSGLKLLSNLKNKNSSMLLNAATPVFIMSGFLESETIKKAAPIASGIFAKPVNAEQIHQKLSQVTGFHLKPLPRQETPESKPESNSNELKPDESILHDLAGKAQILSLLTTQLDSAIVNPADLQKSSDLVKKLGQVSQQINMLISMARLLKD